ncbi:hypothetical protein MHYP_G00075220 [Metynnis hypsauchen]
MRLRREDLRSLDVPAFEVLAEAHSDERKLLCVMRTEHFTEERQKSRKNIRNRRAVETCRLASMFLLIWKVISL